MLSCCNAPIHCYDDAAGGYFCIAMIYCLTKSLKEGRTVLGSQLQRIQSMVVLKACQRDSVQGIASKKQGWECSFGFSPTPSTLSKLPAHGLVSH